MTEQTIAFIGAGAIGLPMASRASAAGDVTVFDNSVERRELASQRALRTASSISDLADADTFLVMVATAGQAEAVLIGEGGLYSVAKPGATIVLLSTLGPEAVVRLSRMRPDNGPELLDAPVTGGIPGAEAGRLTIFAAGNSALIDRVRTVLQSMGSVVVAGENPGDGQAFKMVNQLLATSQLVVAAEALAFAGKLGLDQKHVLDAVQQGAGSSWMLSNYGPRMLRNEVEDIAARTDIFLKDADLVALTAGQVNFDSQFIQATQTVLRRAVSAGLSAEDASRVIEVCQ